MSDLAVDLGTSNLRVWSRSQEVLREPSVVTSGNTRRRWRRSVRLIGREAQQLAEESSGTVELVRPLREGSIADFKAAEILLRRALSVHRRPLAFKGPSVVFGVAPTISELQQRALRRLGLDAGARVVSLVPSSIAVLAGEGLDVAAPSGRMVVDIGGGTTQIAVVSLSSVVVSRSISIGGDHMDVAISDFVQRRFNARLSPADIEQLRIRVGSAHRDIVLDPWRGEGEDLITGAPRAVTVHAPEIYGAIAGLIEEILEAARGVLAVTPPELAADVADGGILLTGGASQLTGLDRVLSEMTRVPVARVADPLGAVARGCARLVTTSPRWAEVCILQ
jgi:rod shape-determining protein MreB and related proteins